jgi:hypothetical protein
MKNSITTFETAILAKKLGFSELCFYYYTHKYGKSKYLEKQHGKLKKCEFGEETSQYSFWARKSNSGQPHIIPAPLQYSLQKWIRDNFKMSIELNVSGNGTFSVEIFGFNDWRNFNIEQHDLQLGFPEHYDKPRFETYEEALEKGLYEALKLIKDE